MKHLTLILISILLLSSPVIGNNHKSETLYGWGKCCDYVWKGFGDKKFHPKYEGEVESGKPNGLGFITFPDGGEYVGELKNGGRNGQGTQTWKDGRKFVGEWRDVLEWNGTLYFKDGNIYGKYVNGKLIKQ